MGQLELE